MISAVLNFARKLLWINDKFASRAIIRENNLSADFVIEVGTKLSGDDFPDFEASMASTTSGVTFRVDPVYCWPTSADLAQCREVRRRCLLRMSTTLLQKNAATLSLKG